MNVMHQPKLKGNAQVYLLIIHVHQHNLIRWVPLTFFLLLFKIRLKAFCKLVKIFIGLEVSWMHLLRDFLEPRSSVAQR